MTREEAIKIIDCYDIGFYDLSGEKIPADKLADAFDIAIEALKAKTDGDIISRQAAIDAMGEEPPVWYDGEDEIAERNQWRRDKAAIESLPSAEPKTGGWIPIKYHEITEIERKENGYPKDWVYFLDCEMPQDGQEILVQAKNGEIRWDVCYEDDGFSLDSGWDWKDDIIAWMPLPTPYKGGEDE